MLQYFYVRLNLIEKKTYIRAESADTDILTARAIRVKAVLSGLTVAVGSTLEKVRKHEEKKSLEITGWSIPLGQAPKR